MSTVELVQVNYKTCKVEKSIEPLCDPGNLLLIDKDSIYEDENKREIPSDEVLLKMARDNTQYLFNKIWDLEKVTVDEAICVKLPAKTYKLPREKPLPKEREPTKWEKYAKEKGIVKTKKDKKIFDEESKTWKPTYGYNRGNDNTKDWLIEIPQNADPMKDFFKERENAKKERTAKNEFQRLKNIARSNNKK